MTRNNQKPIQYFELQTLKTYYLKTAETKTAKSYLSSFISVHCECHGQRDPDSQQCRGDGCRGCGPGHQCSCLHQQRPLHLHC